MKEEEAKQKWCPFARVLLSSFYEEADRIQDPVCNRVEGDDGSIMEDNNKCIGSACMAWRWHENQAPSPKAGKIGDGYCGLAGKP